MITENYIKQCEQAEEIQKEWKPKDWDLFMYKDSRELGRACVDPGHDKKNPNTFVLPTQEQLIKIHFDWYLQRYKGKMSISEYFLYLHEFALIAEESKYKYCTPREMMMGYLYQEKYGKEWTGKEWKEIK